MSAGAFYQDTTTLGPVSLRQTVWSRQSAILVAGETKDRAGNQYSPLG